MKNKKEYNIEADVYIKPKSIIERGRNKSWKLGSFKVLDENRKVICKGTEHTSFYYGRAKSVNDKSLKSDLRRNIENYHCSELRNKKIKFKIRDLTIK